MRPARVSMSAKDSCSAAIFTVSPSGNVNRGSPMGTGDTRTGVAAVMTTPSCSMGHNASPLQIVSPSIDKPSSRAPLRNSRYRGDNWAATMLAPTTPNPNAPIHDSRNGLAILAIRSKVPRVSPGKWAEVRTYCRLASISGSFAESKLARS